MLTASSPRSVRMVHGLFSAYLTALRVSRKDSFLLELRVPDLQVTEAVLLTIIILLLVWNQVRLVCPSRVSPPDDDKQWTMMG